ncbi:MAG: DUF4197 domain-containing protein [Bacteroidales bacterium]
MIKKILPLALLVFITGCSELKQLTEQLDTSRPLTNQEVVDGLKQALTIGSNSAAAGLSETDGYYRDEMVRIMLPPEAQIITENLSLLPGGEKLIEDVILKINRAAEDAAREAAPVFAAAVRTMTIQDGFAILKGENDAATQYLRTRTWNELYGLYQPKIKSSVDKPVAGNISPGESWNTLTTQWNRIANSAMGRLSDLTPVNVELDRYLTEKALDGLFLKLADEEEKIRTNPAARVTDLLKRVFGRA